MAEAKVGRPKSPNKRSESIWVSIREDERALVTLAAKRLGLDPGAYIRACGLMGAQQLLSSDIGLGFDAAQVVERSKVEAIAAKAAVAVFAAP